MLAVPRSAAVRVLCSWGRGGVGGRGVPLCLGGRGCGELGVSCLTLAMLSWGGQELPAWCRRLQRQSKGARNSP